MATAGLKDLIANAGETLSGLSTPQKVVVGAAGGLAGAYLLSKLLSSGSRAKPNSFQLTGGAIAAENVAKEFGDYSAAYSAEAGVGIKDRSKTVHLVDVFYSLVTDLYEWGWGQSFHFSPKLPSKGWKESEAAHEARIAAILNAKPGQKILDCGCGVGGPMRTIAAVSGAHVVGITINEYQVGRATYHNSKVCVPEARGPACSRTTELACVHEHMHMVRALATLPLHSCTPLCIRIPCASC